MQDENKLTTENKQKKKPKWLRKLEEESWQAELIISGLAIYGALQLPHYIEAFIDFSITFFQPENYFFLFVFAMYLFCASTFLIICFIVHFILRAVWIGMLGFNYVFPKGINYDTDQYSPTYLKMLREKFPNNHQNITNLEKACSAMFGIATSMLLIILTLNINILVIFTLKVVLEQFVSGSILKTLTFSLIVLFIILSIVLYSLNLKRFHQNERLQRWYFKMSQIFNKANYHIFYYPMMRIMYLFVTNSTIKKISFAMFAVFFMSSVLTSVQMVRSNLYLLDNAYNLHDKYARTEKLIPEHYEVNLDGTTKLFSAVIPNEKISDDLLKVFVPVFINENTNLDSLCGEWKNDDLLDKRENKQKKRERWVYCNQQYHQFYVNDSLYVAELVSADHPNNGERGVLTYLPTKNFKAGKNILRIEKVKKDGGVYRTINIPFWFERY